MSKLNIKLITPAKTVLEEEVDEVVAETTDGQITILAHHAPLVSILKPGELIIRTDKKDKPLAIAGGVIEMFNNTLVILADTAEHVEEIDLDRAEKRAQELAEKLKDKEKLDINTYTNLEYMLARDRARIGVSKKWRK
ncbi:MAG: ATP synthase F1 subunit epsilon [Parcubacteria group bacterium CG_4_9_14_0_2_um_filter_41_8]|nr:MAG: ATP synthase F1 subunit epsilon [Parcubacteria group bacterium CG1_02_41_12]PIQ79837.1 MAG: ATP synthase F1 subunit epsilon [Parcubacteria group bacterium CG11_big_fil_rev_8_21_14_0_20_41_14]PIR57467.1 MAG: ATP synthase F1 subunit epsilon [Parcubacteria group bacterium CG10_big_fil_rev_8_21_14_0_10_41_35]PIZ80391.1 MAG: ATP synthase F1 subunit epsilon [Parcubacteria group bacterium CG_4_10_14_0_2_um_filter_41_6]PJC40991.1 MAG: ATP synthase F1 subunit epsilon [Parcubacteria group bacteri